MGVTGLWKILAPAGRRVDISTLRGKVLAVDASIWLIQFVKAMRDADCQPLPNAHLIGTLSRVLRLLYNRIRPVFVFDGGTPTLKRRTVLKRSEQRATQDETLRRTLQRLVLVSRQRELAQKKSTRGAPVQQAFSDVTVVSTAQAGAGAGAGVGTGASVGVGALEADSDEDEIVVPRARKVSEFLRQTPTVRDEEDAELSRAIALSLGGTDVGVHAGAGAGRARGADDAVTSDHGSLSECEHKRDESTTGADVGVSVGDAEDDDDECGGGFFVAPKPKPPPTRILPPPPPASRRARPLTRFIDGDDESDGDDDAAFAAASFRPVVPSRAEDLDFEALAALPAHLQKEYTEEMTRSLREASRRTLVRTATDPTSFASAQLKLYLKSAELNIKLDAMNAEAAARHLAGQRIAGDSGREFVLLEERPDGTSAPMGVSGPRRMPQLPAPPPPQHPVTTTSGASRAEALAALAPNWKNAEACDDFSGGGVSAPLFSLDAVLGRDAAAAARAAPAPTLNDLDRAALYFKNRVKLAWRGGLGGGALPSASSSRMGGPVPSAGGFLVDGSRGRGTWRGRGRGGQKQALRDASKVGSKRVKDLFSTLGIGTAAAGPFTREFEAFAQRARGMETLDEEGGAKETLLTSADYDGIHEGHPGAADDDMLADAVGHDDNVADADESADADVVMMKEIDVAGRAGNTFGGEEEIWDDVPPAGASAHSEIVLEGEGKKDSVTENVAIEGTAAGIDVLESADEWDDVPEQPAYDADREERRRRALESLNQFAGDDAKSGVAVQNDTIVDGALDAVETSSDLQAIIADALTAAGNMTQSGQLTLRRAFKQLGLPVAPDAIAPPSPTLEDEETEQLRALKREIAREEELRLTSAPIGGRSVGDDFTSGAGAGAGVGAGAGAGAGTWRDGTRMGSAALTVTPYASFSAMRSAATASAAAYESNSDGDSSQDDRACDKDDADLQRALALSIIPSRPSAQAGVSSAQTAGGVNDDEDGLKDDDGDVRDAVVISERPVHPPIVQSTDVYETDAGSAALNNLRAEERALKLDAGRAARDTSFVSNEMLQEVMGLLEFCGIPYIVAPMEAEAQCAAMELSGAVDGVITDDSDAFLFGAQHVYKNIFDDSKFVEAYTARDIKSDLNLSRDDLIRLALLLGSDYTLGIKGVGPVNAIEVIRAFSGDDGLREFGAWVNSTSPAMPLSRAVDEKARFKASHEAARRRWDVGESFPNRLVLAAYRAPTITAIDGGRGALPFRPLEVEKLRIVMTSKLGMSTEKADERLNPVIESLASGSVVQTTLAPWVTQYGDRVKAGKIVSKRMTSAIAGIKGVDEGEAELADIAITAEERAAIAAQRAALRTAKSPIGGGATQPRGKKRTAADGAGPRAFDLEDLSESELTALERGEAVRGGGAGPGVDAGDGSDGVGAGAGRSKRRKPLSRRAVAAKRRRRNITAEDFAEAAEMQAVEINEKSARDEPSE